MEYQMYTSVGSRDINEDYIAMTESNGTFCFVLCDGLGGHGKGEVASKMAAESIIRSFLEKPVMSDAEICRAFESAQASLLEEQVKQHLKNEMKTTAVVLYLGKQSAVWAHIGDSRLYVFRKNKVVLRTLDHSVPQMLVMAGEIKEKHIRQHPDRNRLMRVMGAEWSDRKYDISEPAAADSCQAFLLCSDGFWENITEKTMCKLLKKSSSVQEWMKMMTEEVNQNGQGKDMDNNSAIAVWM